MTIFSFIARLVRTLWGKLLKLLDLSLVIFERLWDFLLLLEIVYTWRGFEGSVFFMFACYDMGDLEGA